VIGPQQLREEHHEEAVFEEIVLLDLAAAGVDQIRDFLNVKNEIPSGSRCAAG